jgi:hypothetical protein
MRLKSGQRLGDAYRKADLPTLRRRFYRYGVRLAPVLNQVFSWAMLTSEVLDGLDAVNKAADVPTFGAVCGRLTLLYYCAAPRP